MMSNNIISFKLIIELEVWKNININQSLSLYYTMNQSIV